MEENEIIFNKNLIQNHCKICSNKATYSVSVSKLDDYFETSINGTKRNIYKSKIILLCTKHMNMYDKLLSNPEKYFTASKKSNINRKISLR